MSFVRVLSAFGVVNICRVFHLRVDRFYNQILLKDHQTQEPGSSRIARSPTLAIAFVQTTCI